jgi:hypothetical protein
MNVDQHIKLVAIFNIAFSSILAFVGLVAFVFFAGIGIASGDPDAVPILGFVGTVGLIFMGGLALPGILGGIGLLKRKEWARILIIAVSCINLFAFPIGTGLSIYAFWVLFNDETIKQFQTVKTSPQA